MIYQDVIVGKILSDVIRLYRQNPVYVVVLCPRVEIVAEREARRHKRGYNKFLVKQLDEILRKETPRVGLWLDSSELSVDETVEQILADLDKAKVPGNYRRSK